MENSFFHKLKVELGYEHAKPIEIAEDPMDFLTQIKEQATEPKPVIFREFANSWPAVQMWGTDYLASLFGSQPISVAIDLPSTKLPYIHTDDAVRSETTFKAFCDTHINRDSYYIDQHSIVENERMLRDLKLNQLTTQNMHAVAFWLGKGTNSGLHFDLAENFIIMIKGCKNVALVDPRDSKSVYPYTDRALDSQVDIESPDFTRFPKAKTINLFGGELREGDVLYIPRGWWHYLASDDKDFSISVNCWFGQIISGYKIFKYILSLGFSHTMHALRDFFVHGLLSYDWSQPYLSTPKSGVLLYFKFVEFVRGVFVKESE